MLKISSMKERISIETLTSIVDNRGNPVETWTPMYNCWANAISPTGSEIYSRHAASSARDGYDGAEYYGAKMPLYEDKVKFTIRYTPRLKNIDTTKHRVIWNGRTYNLLGVDNITAKNEKLMLTCICKDHNRSLEGDEQG